MPVVICNTSALQYLHQIDLLDLLPALFGQVQIPRAVAAEMDEGKRRNVSLPTLEALSWLTIRPIRDRTLLPLITSLGDGEKEVLALGLEATDALLVLDDRNARRYATAAELEVTGTLGILILAKDRGLLGSIRPALERLQALRFRLSAATLQRVLDLAGEGKET